MQLEETQRKIKDLRERREHVKQGGGLRAMERHYRSKGMLTPRERIEYLLDPGTFKEIDMFVKCQRDYFGLGKMDIPDEGVICGCGKVNGRLTFVYSQDFTVMGGSFGQMHGAKICKVLDKAASVGAPIVQICHSGGARLQEAVDSQVAFGDLFYRNAVYSGVIPQISLIMGTVAGGQTYSPGLTDFIFMTKGSSMFVAGPSFVKTQISEKATEEELGGAKMHSTVSGVCDLVAENDKNCLDKTREILSYLPSNNREKPPVVPSNDDPRRETPELERIVPPDIRVAYDVHKAIRVIVDDGKFFEIKPTYARNMVIGFAGMGRRTVGIVANQSMFQAGVVTVEAAEKAARFVRFCDAFNIPVLSFMDTPAYMIGTQEERKGMICRGAKLLYCWAEATVPKITLILRKGFAGAYLAQGSKFLGADLVFAWPTAEIGGATPDTIGSVIFRKDTSEEKQKHMEEYQKIFSGPYYAAGNQHIDDVIELKDSRSVLIWALETLENKDEKKPWRKHGVYPM